MLPVLVPPADEAAWFRETSSILRLHPPYPLSTGHEGSCSNNFRSKLRYAFSSKPSTSYAIFLAFEASSGPKFVILKALPTTKMKHLHLEGRLFKVSEVSPSNAFFDLSCGVEARFLVPLEESSRGHFSGPKATSEQYNAPPLKVAAPKCVSHPPGPK